jgi:hypothetical protein
MPLCKYMLTQSCDTTVPDHIGKLDPKAIYPFFKSLWSSDTSHFSSQNFKTLFRVQKWLTCQLFWQQTLHWESNSLPSESKFSRNRIQNLQCCRSQTHCWIKQKTKIQVLGTQNLPVDIIILNLAVQMLLWVNKATNQFSCLSFGKSVCLSLNTDTELHIYRNRTLFPAIETLRDFIQCFLNTNVNFFKKYLHLPWKFADANLKVLQFNQNIH